MGPKHNKKWRGRGDLTQAYVGEVDGLLKAGAGGIRPPVKEYWLPSKLE